MSEADELQRSRLDRLEDLLAGIAALAEWAGDPLDVPGPAAGPEVTARIRNIENRLQSIAALADVGI